MKVQNWLSMILMTGLCSCAHQAKEMKETKSNGNPFLEAYNTPFQTPPFDRIENRHFLPAFTEAIEQHRQQIDEIAGSSEEPTFENTLGARDRSGELLDRVDRTLSALKAANTNDELEEIAKHVAPQLSKHRDEITQNEKLFARIKAIYQKKESLKLTVEQSSLLENTFQQFIRGGGSEP